MEEKLFNPVNMLDFPVRVQYSSRDYVVNSMKKELKENKKLGGRVNTGLFK
jgi:benzoyl-CoA reductase/2-hydroxyglutaryl-CoA dehydratase subunit BcrC/BadD/HgdB